MSPDLLRGAALAAIGLLLDNPEATRFRVPPKTSG